jgi:hypothetical protein
MTKNNFKNFLTDTIYNMTLKLFDTNVLKSLTDEESFDAFTTPANC